MVYNCSTLYVYSVVFRASNDVTHRHPTCRRGNVLLSPTAHYSAVGMGACTGCRDPGTSRRARGVSASRQQRGD